MVKKLSEYSEKVVNKFVLNGNIFMFILNKKCTHIIYFVKNFFLLKLPYLELKMNISGKLKFLLKYLCKFLHHTGPTFE